jgi:nicotinamide mononucleotide transporter
VNLVIGIAGVALMIRRSLWAFPVGLVAVAVQGVLFFRAKFYADATQQIFFFGALAWGWWHWMRAEKRDEGVASPASRELPVGVLSWRARVVTMVAGGVAVAVWALALQRWTDAVMPWRDAFIAVFGIVAQVLQARKVIENWPLWVVVNVVAIAAYWKADLAYTAFLYAIYLGLAVVGWREWARARAEADVKKRDGGVASPTEARSERDGGVASPTESRAG